MTFTIATSLLPPLQEHVRGYGTQDAEAGGFLLGATGVASADVLALAEGVGIERSRGLFRVSGTALERLFAWADDHELRVWAQVHSHPRGSFLSPTDKTYGFRVEGFLSAIIPDYPRPPLDPHTWGWWTFTAGVWRRAGTPSVADVPARVIVFDETGVR